LCYRHSGQDIAEFADDVRADLEGDPFPQQEIISASNDLQEKEYITIAMFRPQITAKGKTIVEICDSSIANTRTAASPPRAAEPSSMSTPAASPASSPSVTTTA
jgi:hypothetical protein